MITYDYDHPAAAEALAAMPAMYAGLREALTLPSDDPRRAAAIAEKHRVLGLIAAAQRQPSPACDDCGLVTVRPGETQCPDCQTDRS